MEILIGVNCAFIAFHVIKFWWFGDDANDGIKAIIFLMLTFELIK